MGEASVRLDPAFAVGPLDRRIFGTFVEHMGRCVYTGIYEPGHPTADEHGFRTDVADLVRELGLTDRALPRAATSSPTTSWEDGVGPKEDRPTQARPRLALHRDQPGRHRRLHRLGAAASAIEPMLGRQPRHPRRAPRPIDLLAVLQRRGRHRWPDRRVEERPRRAARHPGLVPRQRDGRPVADGPQDRRGVRPARRGDRPRHAPGRRDASSSSPAGRPTAACRPSARGSASSSSAASTSSTTSPRTPTTSPSTATSTPSSRAARTCTASSSPSSRRPTTSPRSRAPTSGSCVSFDEWNVWFQKRFHGESSPRDPRGPRADRGRLRRHRRRRRRQPADHPAAAHRPGLDGLPGAARQRHRPHRHPPRRGRVEADDLPPLRPHREVCPWHRAAPGRRLRRDGDQGLRARRPARRHRDPRPRDRRPRRLRGQPQPHRDGRADDSTSRPPASGGHPTAYALVEHLQVHDDDTCAPRTPRNTPTG